MLAKHKRLIIAGVLVLVLLVGAVVVAVTFTAKPAEPVAKPTVTPTAAARVATPLPNSDAFLSWTQKNPSDAVTFRAERLDDEHGWSLIVASNQELGDAAPSLTQPTHLPEQGTYEVSFVARSVGVEGGPVNMLIGNPIDILQPSGERGASSVLEVTNLSEEWASYSVSYTTPGSDLRFGVRIHAPRVGSVAIDNIVITGPSGPVQIITAGDFEANSAPLAISNASLLLQQSDAYVDVASRAYPSATGTWSLNDKAGVAVATDTLDIAEGFGEIDLRSIDYGLYDLSVNVELPEGPQVVQTRVAIVRDAETERDPAEMAFGIHLHYGAGTERTASLIESFGSLGIGHVRADVPWWWSEKANGEYVYDGEIVDAMDLYSELGMSALQVAAYSNPKYDSGATPSSPDGLRAYGAFTANILSTFSDVHSDVEVYNEFDHLGNSACGPTADCYIDMLKATSEAVRATSASSKIAAPGNAGMGFHFDWLSRFFELGGLQYLDAVSAHPYVQPEGPEKLIPDLDQLNGMIAANLPEGQTKPVWITEMGWATVPDWVSDEQQAAYNIRFAALALSRGVERIYWYEAADTSPDPRAIEGNFGLFDAETQQLPNANAPKLSAVALATFEDLIGAAKVTGADDLGEGVFSIVFGSGESAVRVVWSTAGPLAVRTAGDAPYTVVTMDGAEAPVSVDGAADATISLTDQPVFIQGDIDSLVRVE